MAARGMANKYQGSKWIRREKRLAIYLRDGLCCAYCGSTIEDGASLTLDHLRPYSEQGSNHESNLITCCQKCNSARGSRSIDQFAAKVAEYLNHDLTATAILIHIAACTARPIDVDAAKEIITSRGCWKDSLR